MKMITNIHTLIVLCLLILPSLFLPAAEKSTVLSQNGKKAELPITLQLKASANHIEYRKPIDFYLTFTNQCTASREFIFSQISELSNSSMLTFNLGQQKDHESMIPLMGYDLPVLILQPRQSITIKFPTRLLPPGKYTVAVRYNVKMRWPVQEGLVISNPVEIMVEDRPLSEREAETLRSEYAALAKEFENTISHIKETGDVNNDVFINDAMKVFSNKFMAGSPYSIPALMDLMENSSYPYIRRKAMQTLAVIGSPEKSPKNLAFPCHRDTMAEELFLKRIRNEPVSELKCMIILLADSWIDVMTPQQKADYRNQLLEQLDSTNGDFRFTAALVLARHFPEDSNTIISRIKNKDFCFDFQQQMILFEIEKKK